MEAITERSNTGASSKKSGGKDKKASRKQSSRGAEAASPAAVHGGAGAALSTPSPTTQKQGSKASTSAVISKTALVKPAISFAAIAAAKASSAGAISPLFSATSPSALDVSMVSMEQEEEDNSPADSSFIVQEEGEDSLNCTAEEELNSSMLRDMAASNGAAAAAGRTRSGSIGSAGRRLIKSQAAIAGKSVKKSRMGSGQAAVQVSASALKAMTSAGAGARVGTVAAVLDPAVTKTFSWGAKSTGSSSSSKPVTAEAAPASPAAVPAAASSSSLPSSSSSAAAAAPASPTDFKALLFGSEVKPGKSWALAAGSEQKKASLEEQNSFFAELLRSKSSGQAAAAAAVPFAATAVAAPASSSSSNAGSVGKRDAAAEAEQGDAAGSDDENDITVGLTEEELERRHQKALASVSGQTREGQRDSELLRETRKSILCSSDQNTASCITPSLYMPSPSSVSSLLPHPLCSASARLTLARRHRATRPMLHACQRRRGCVAG